MGGDFIGDTFNTPTKSSGTPRAQHGSSLGSNHAFSSLAYLALLAFIFWWRTMRKPHKVSGLPGAARSACPRLPSAVLSGHSRL